MKEINHRSLFEPPAGTTAIVIPVSREVHENAAMSRGYARQAKKRWPIIARSVGFWALRLGNIPVSITRPYVTRERQDGWIGIPVGGFLPGLEVPWHIVTFPIRAYDHSPIDDELVSASARRLRDLCAGKNEEIWWLAEGNIVMPQLRDKNRDWPHFRSIISPWLDEPRFIVISGNRGTLT